MADLFGGAPLPARPPVAGQPVNDPSLYFLATFLREVANAECGAAWLDLDPGGTPEAPGPVSYAFSADPKKSGIETNYLPSIYVFRNELLEIVHWAGDKYLHRWDVHVLWVTPPAQEGPLVPLDMPDMDDVAAEAQRPLWSTMFNAWTAALYRGSHPAWIVPGDTTRGANTNGSSLAQMMRFQRLAGRGGSRVPIDVDPLSPNEAAPSVDGYLYKVWLEEVYEPDPMRRGARLAGLRQTVSTDPHDPLGPAQTETVGADTPTS